MKKNVTEKIFLIIFLSFFSLSVFADVYRSIDSDGVVTYSDQPQLNSKPLTLPPANISTPSTNNQINKQLSETLDQKANSDAQSNQYQSFEITYPIDQNTFQNEIDIPVLLSVSPELSKDNAVELLVDGKVFSKPQHALDYTLPKVIDGQTFLTRGSHTLQANLLDQNNKIIMQTKKITIFIHYASTLNPVSGAQ